ncbi:MAG: urea ABC transporter permease subunit UrtB [Candidatus Rokubacteria bacterium]|nr:urea ABC transporter permease subunit UrtB [Candidatus Rokubacteria bacterium]
MRRLLLLAVFAWLASAGHAAALTPEQVSSALASDDGERREAAVAALGRTGDPKWLAFLSALRDGSVYAHKRGHRVELVVGGAKSARGDQEVVEIVRAYDRTPLGVVPVAELTEVAADRRLRLAIKPFLDASETRLQLADADPAVRRGAAVKLGHQADPGALPLVEEALARETDRWTRHALAEARALIGLAHGDAAARVEAAQALGGLHATSALPALRRLATGAASAAERDAAAAAVRRIERWTMLATTLETAFQGASLASILLLMALGLAVVFGLMGVINMAHGELMALGAYTTFVVQNWFRDVWPERFDLYFLVALPLAFTVAGAAGLVLERGVIRRLYGRPLETLLLTWGASLIIQQALRLWFGAANVDVASPRWLSGGLPVMVGLQLPWNRTFIIGLAALALGGMYWLLFRTSTGLAIRAVTQNRQMSACLGVRAGVVDATTFALGAGLAGLAGAALTQIGNVGPSLGQHYIVDSFMVVVTGGVGKLAGTILAAAGIGGLNKGIEPALGAVFAKVLILVAVIVFLQRRPAGLFAARGRHAEA